MTASRPHTMAPGEMDVMDLAIHYATSKRREREREGRARVNIDSSFRFRLPPSVWREKTDKAPVDGST